MSGPLTWTNTRVKLSALKPWSLNPRQSTKKQAARLLASWDRFGQVQAIAIGPDNEVYDGHQRLSALLTVHGNGYEVDARRSNVPLSDQERRELVVTLHAGAVGSWDWDAISSWDAPSLIEWGFDANTLTDWKRDVGALTNLIESEKPEPADAEPQVDRAEELRVKWGTERGQLWRIGAHRLLCGDSTVAEDVARAMGGERAALAPVDPPYNIGYSYDVYKDNLTPDQYSGRVDEWLESIRQASERQIVTPGRQNLAVWLSKGDCHVASWVKSNAHGGASIAHFAKWEPVLFYGKHLRKRASDVFEHHVDNGFLNDDAAVGHACPKPLRLWEDLIENYSEPGDVIFEAFSGSGTTLVACENLGRRGRGIEISPAYCAVVLERMATAFPGIEIEKI